MRVSQAFLSVSEVPGLLKTLELDEDAEDLGGGG